MRTATLTKDQRDRTLMLRTVDTIMRTDYALPWNHDRYSSVETHATAVYDTMDPTQWDGHFIRATRRYLAEYRDPNLRLMVPPRFEQHLWGRGFWVRRDGEALVVVETCGEERLHPGDRIVKLGGRDIPTFRAQAKFWLRAGNPECELWDLALDAVEDVTLADTSTLELHRHAPALPERPVVHVGTDGIAHVVLRQFAPFAVPSDISGLIIDVRHCSDGTDADAALAALLPLLVGEPTQQEDLLGQTWHVNCSAHNVDRKVAALRALLGCECPREEAREIERIIADLAAQRGKGFSEEREDVEGGIVEPVGAFPVAVLTDVGTAGTAERLARIAKGQPRCTVAGRPTQGGIETSDLCAADLGDGYTLVYPTAAASEPYRDHGRPAGQGIEPTVRIPWSPAHLTCDADVDAARAMLASARSARTTTP